MTGEDVPRARVRRKRSWLLHAFWIVPIVAVAVAGWLIAKKLRAYGPEIAIEFRDGSGLRSGQTPVKFRGVYIGEVSRIELTEDHSHVLVYARLKREAASLAREGTKFWVVRPQVGWGNVTGLGTVISGPEIQLLEGKGESAQRFKGLEHAPVAAAAQPGLLVVLKAERPVSLRPGSPVYYRGVEVGTVQSIDLSSDSRAAELHLLVYQRFAALVRTGSAFWNVSGISLTGSILKGVQLDIDSLRTIITGGIEFASPEGSPPAKAQTAFFLNKSPRKEWLGWNPKIGVPPEEAD
jgi:paraquat-inducible protein B